MFNLFSKRRKLISIIFLIAILTCGVFVVGARTSSQETKVLSENIKETVVKPTEVLTPTSTPASYNDIQSYTTPTFTPTPTNEQYHIDSKVNSNTENQNNKELQTTQTELTPSTSDDAYLDYLHQQQNQNIENSKKCTEWANERDEALLPLKQNIEIAKQKIQDEENAIDNNPQLTSVQKSQRKLSVLPPLQSELSQAQTEYQTAFNSYGSCPHS